MQSGPRKSGDSDARRRIISPGFKNLSIEEQCRILGLSRSTYYYRPKQGEPERNLEIMKVIYKQFTECSAMGVRQMVDFLRGKGYKVGKKLVRRLMNLMDMRAIYPMKSLSKGGWVKYRMPYLLRNLLIDRPNQVWCTDSSYVAMEHGFIYLYAIIDVYSRYIVGWGLYNSFDASNAIEVLDAAVRRHGAPEIINSDQGCQYTNKEWHETCEKAWRTTLIITTPDAIIRALIIKFRRPDMRPLSRLKSNTDV